MPVRTRRRFAVVTAAAAALATAALAAPGAAVADPNPTATVTGAVTGPSGELLAGVPVTMAYDDLTVRTDVHGRYRATVPSHSITYPCADPGAHDTGGTSAGGYVKGCGDAVTPKNGTTVTRDVRLAVGASLSGRIVDDRTGTPIAGTGVLVQQLFTDYFVDVNAVTTAADGTWFVRGLDARYETWVIATGSARSADAPFGWLQDHESHPSVAVHAGAVTKFVSFRLQPLAKVVAKVTTPRPSDTAFFTTDGPQELLAPSREVRPVARYGSAPADGQVCAEGVYDASSPLGLATRCQDVPFSATTQTKVSFTLQIGGGVTGALTGATAATRLWIDFDGHRIDGHTDEATTSFYLGNVPTGTWVIHASDSDTGRTGRSAPVHVVQGTVTRNVPLALH